MDSNGAFSSPHFYLTHPSHVVDDVAFASGNLPFVVFTSSLNEWNLKLQAHHSPMLSLGTTTPWPEPTHAKVQRSPSVAALDGGFLVVWEEERLDGGLDVRFRAFDGAGAPLGPPRELGRGPYVEHDGQAASDGVRYWTVFQRIEPTGPGAIAQATVVVSRIEAPFSGAAAQVAVATYGAPSVPQWYPWFRRSIVAGPAGAVVAWVRWDNSDSTVSTFTANVTADGGTTGPLRVTPPGRNGQGLAMAIGEGRIALVSREQAGLVVRWLDETGRPLPEAPLSVSASGANNVDLAYGNGTYLLVWEERLPSDYQGVMAQRFSADAGLLDQAPWTLWAPDPARPDDDPVAQLSVAHDGVDFVVLISAFVNPANIDAGADVYVLRVPGAGRPSTPVSTLASALLVEAADQQTPSVAALGPGRLAVAYETFDVAQNVMRVEALVWGNPPDGGGPPFDGGILDGGDIDAGSLDGGIDDTDEGTPDAGTGGRVSRFYRVGCDCGSVPSSEVSALMLAVPLASALLCSKRRWP